MKNKIKGNDKEEYVTTLTRESCSPAERQLEAGLTEGSFGTGSLKGIRHIGKSADFMSYVWLPVWIGLHASSPLTDNEIEIKVVPRISALYQCKLIGGIFIMEDSLSFSTAEDTGWLKGERRCTKNLQRPMTPRA